MKMIEIKDGFSVRLDAIEAVEQDVAGCKVYTVGTVYKSKLPYLAMVKLLRNEPDSNGLLKSISENQQRFAG